MGGVLCTLSAWVIGFASLVARVRAGREVAALPRLAFWDILYSWGSQLGISQKRDVDARLLVDGAKA
jgi:hypothetical protein